MINKLLGTKSNMTAVFDQFGHRVPVTSVVAEPNIVLGLKEGKVVLGFSKKKKSKKTENAISKIAGYSPKYIKEAIIKKTQDPESSQEPQQSNNKINIGDKITVSIFKVGDEVKVTGTTKGKGFAGGVKRWGFHGGPKTHGQSDRHRAPGSIGMGTTPGRVFKGKKMAGHMGNTKLTVTGLEVIEVDEVKNLLIVKGSVPGPTNGFLIIEKTGKAKGYTPPPSPSEEKQAEKEAKTETKENKDNKKEESAGKDQQKTNSNEDKSEEKQELKPKGEINKKEK